MPWRHWELSEWLINYQGGFVRRGLWGELLFFLHRRAGVDPALVIHFIVLVSVCTLVCVVVRMFYKNGYSCFLLPFVFMLGGLWAPAWTLMEGRRDALMLTLAAAAFWFYGKWLKNNSFGSVIAIWMIGCFAILSHEPSFFIVFPFMGAHLFLHQLQRHSFWAAARRVAAAGTPVLLCMALVCHFKGNQTVAEAIWNSWQPLFAAHPRGDVSQLGYGQAFMLNGTLDAIKMHFKGAWVSARDCCGFPPALIWEATFFAIYYLVTGVNRIDAGFYKLRPVRAAALSDVLITQFLMLLPMWGFLSFDFGRTIVYWTLSSFFIYTFIPAEELALLPRKLRRFSEIVTGQLNSTWPFKSNAFYISAALCVGVSFYSCQAYLIFRSSALGQMWRSSKALIGSLFGAG